MKRLIKIFILSVILMILFATLLFASGIVKIITPPEGSIEIGGPDDTFFIQEISTTDSTIRFKVIDDNLALALEADFKIITSSRQEMYESLSSLNVYQKPYGLKLRGDSVMPILKIYDGYMKDVIDK